jgi:hypothetical protein
MGNLYKGVKLHHHVRRRKIISGRVLLDAPAAIPIAYCLEQQLAKSELISVNKKPSPHSG